MRAARGLRPRAPGLGAGPFRGTQKGQRQKHTKGKATSEGILAPGPRARGVCLYISMFAYDRRLRQAQPRRSFAWLHPSDLTGPPTTPLLLHPVSDAATDFPWSITVSRTATEATRSISERCAMPFGRDASDSCFAWKLARHPTHIRAAQAGHCEIADTSMYSPAFPAVRYLDPEGPPQAWGWYDNNSGAASVAGTWTKIT